MAGIIARYRRELEGVKVRRLALEAEQAAVRQEWREWVEADGDKSTPAPEESECGGKL